MIVPMLLIFRFAANIDPERLVKLLVRRRNYYEKYDCNRAAQAAWQSKLRRGFVQENMVKQYLSLDEGAIALPMVIFNDNRSKSPR